MKKKYGLSKNKSLARGSWVKKHKITIHNSGSGYTDEPVIIKTPKIYRPHTKLMTKSTLSKLRSAMKVLINNGIITTEEYGKCMLKITMRSEEK